MAYIMLLNLRYVLFFVYPIIERLKKIFMRCFTMGSIVIYRTIIMPNTLNKVTHCIELKIVKSWLS